MTLKRTSYLAEPAADTFRSAFRRLAEDRGRGVCLVGKDGVCIEVNESFTQAFAAPEERLVGEPVAGFLRSARGPDGAGLLDDAQRGRERREGRDTLLFPDGATREVRYSCLPLGESGEVLLTVEVAGWGRSKTTPGAERPVEAELRGEIEVLRTLHEASRILSFTLSAEEIGTELLHLMRGVSGLIAAVIDTEDEEGAVRIWRSSGLDALWPKARFSPPAETARERALREGAPQSFEIPRPPGLATDGPASVFALYLPLRVQDRVVGLLEVYSETSLGDPDRSGLLGSLATQAATALDNARLYRELSERERQLEDLVSRLLNAQEEERRRVAYEVHDGLAQTAAAAHHHLQAYSRLRGPETAETHGALAGALTLLKRTVAEARRVIAYLRPTALDDFGLQRAIRMEVDELRAEGWEVAFEGGLDEKDRLAPEIETALFRVAQQAVNNARKHARTRGVRVVLRRVGDTIRLRVRDRGEGFDPAEVLPGRDRDVSRGPGLRVGLASMKERISLLGGEFKVFSRPGAGTLVSAKVPLAAGGGRRVGEGWDHPRRRTSR
ncbi:Histidine kinase-, DNA gyrase B-, and HSP90-like ATPase [Rubrobacter radiotolerans]|uniref:Oxygen sensor histidine kinase NreB n=1 Tax=Rubrobacter radiotolerans TaxID=42256 RepID=A0A023X5V3_RUBRA|nr:ATP-binding protein [Rubrobacter radiotolerans]AHY47385.1 Histidine kinase-, DNA gyrase B-, and HSP90-like ATPase [Rubrobacter radiotolerans]MDX5894788.1 PAS domain-containing protein [Rubrobacter radiotolerans]SMC06766.1 GAF domain-containing protein [Rubrobacter radiotolerans DSM 5868]